MDSPYRMALENKYDNRRPLNTVFTLDPTKRSLDFQMNYDLGESYSSRMSEKTYCKTFNETYKL